MHGTIGGGILLLLSCLAIYFLVAYQQVLLLNWEIPCCCIVVHDMLQSSIFCPTKITLDMVVLSVVKLFCDRGQLINLHLLLYIYS